jgi:hypothetical protein
LVAERKAVESRHAEARGVVTEKITQLEKGAAGEKAVKATGVNPRYTQDAKKIREESPETFEVRG